MYGSCARGFTFFWFHGRSSAPRLEKVLKLYRRIRGKVAVMTLVSELELELIQTQMTQKPMLRAEVYARALRASQNRKEDSV